MSIRGLVFLLILYTALAWVVVALLYQQDGVPVILHMGLLWTAAGLAAVLIWLLVQQILGWWRLHRARAKSRPVQAAAGPAPARVHEDDAAFAALIVEADTKLMNAPEGSRRALREYPIYLIIGPDGSGKTSLLHNAGVDARLLAGQVIGAGAPVTSTRIANIWLANEAIFIEVGGRAFQFDPARFGGLLNVLKPAQSGKSWKDWWNPAVQALRLRGVILCWDLGGFVAAQDRTWIERNSQTVRDRLFKIAEVFGMRCPVYTVFTKADTIPFFTEFFDRMAESESGQPFGILGDQAVQQRSEEAVWAEAESKRLTRDFNRLFGCLNARRVFALYAEPLVSRKPAIYEFPREFKRLRTPIVQFLVDSLRPDPLAVSPVLRGFFFAAVRQVEAAIQAAGETVALQRDKAAVGATGFFSAGVTQIFNPAKRSANLVDKPAFTRDFFKVILWNDQPQIEAPQKLDPHVDQRRKMVATAAAAAAGLIVLAFTISWVRNRALIVDVKSGIAMTAPSGAQMLGTESLVALDSLRRVLVDRLDQPKPLSMNWGLYTGDTLRENVRQAYFGRLRQMVLIHANAALVADLRHLDAAQGQPYETVFGKLKTHITISSGACPVDARLVGETLKAATLKVHPDLDPSRQEVVNRQIDYYVAALANGNPAALTQDGEAVQNARSFLTSSRGPEQIYLAILAEVRKDARRVRIGDHVQDYKQVISAPEEVSYEFTKEGRQKFEKLADSGKFNLAGESCVLGAANRLEQGVASIDQVRQAKGLYYRKYIEAWQSFLGQTNVRGYGGAADAAVKLDKLSSPSSPLLSLVRFVGENTYFPAPIQANDAGGVVNQVLNTVVGNAKKKAENAERKLQSLQAPVLNESYVMQVFQPVQAVEPSASPNLVTEKNKEYVNGLQKLGQSLDRYRSASPTEQAPLIQPLQEAYTAAENAQRTLAYNFNQDTEGVNTRVAEILLQPIRNAKPLIPTNKEDVDARGRNGKLAQMCSVVGPVLRKYPFNRQSGSADATLPELSAAFAPGDGAVWKFASETMKDLLVKNGAQWAGKPDAPLQVRTELIDFLNRAQSITDIFFNAGAHEPQFTYSLRPVKQNTLLKLELGGRVLDQKESMFQKDFIWPGSGEATGAVFAGENQFGFGSYPGIWGVFRLFQYADDRPVGEKVVTWSRQAGTGINAQPQPMTPVKVQFVQFPGGQDIFNPHFLPASMNCPRQAVGPQ
jgi:type VI secretion system protein ImpL